MEGHHIRTEGARRVSFPRPMSENLLHDFEALLAANSEGESAREYIRTLGDDGLDRLVRQTEADYTQAVSSIELSGRDAARIAAVAHVLSNAVGIDSREGRETVARLVEVGWIMSWWYGRS